ncbi:amino acid ABC transporter substrate-binding protein [Picosynechococcus sp. PCC 7003]|uniref:ABC transporter substrate-binding protein n=1 Tax=Picosynechococcus sp. PCC 7003 TaxID=374981 RepID=UPI000810E021|nr:ABC transporter substrate-binding protein [Picosynechococcus sp. PCC 7003]ANV84884.1 amino acid ABC transporter substrate-binding protein [Picosynechococcus sp. PCC 7003]
MQTSKFNLAIALSLAAIATFTGACQDTTAPTDGNGETSTNTGAEGLKLGSLTPTTGDLSSIGQNMPIAVELAVETINACGGVNEQPVTLIQEDSQTDPTAGGAAMTKLAEVDRVAGVVGAFASSVSSAAVDVAVRNQVMLVSPGSTSPVFTERAANGDFDGYWARTAPPDSYQAPALAVLAQKQGFERVSTVVINNDYGVGFEQEFIKAFENLGGTIVNKDNPVRYDPKAATLDSEAAAAFAGEPDAVLGVLYAETGSLLLKAAYEQGLSEGITILLTDGVYSEDFTQQVGTTAAGQSIIAGALGTVPGADGPALEAFTALWKEKTGKDVTAYVPHSWDAAIAMMLAAEAADVNTGEGIKNKLREVTSGDGQEVSDPCEAIALVREGQAINYQGASGNVDFDENGDVAGNYDVWTVNDDASLSVIDTVNPLEAL